MRTCKSAVCLFVSCLMFLMSGCAATQMYLENKETGLEARVLFDNPIFLDPAARKDVYVEVRNMSSVKLDVKAIQQEIENKLVSNQYNIVPAADAYYRLQVQMLNGVASVNPARNTGQPLGGAAGTLAGGLIGAAAGRDAGSTLVGGGVGALAGGLAEAIVGSAVAKVQYVLKGMVRISTAESVVAETPMTVIAEGINLKPQDAQLMMYSKLAESLSGIF